MRKLDSNNTSLVRQRVNYFLGTIIFFFSLFSNTFATSIQCNFAPTLQCTNHKNIHWENPQFSSSTTLLKTKTMLFLSQNDKTYGLELDSGKQVWQRQAAKNARYFYPILKGSHIYLARTDGILEKLNTETGHTIWIKTIANGWIYPPAIVKNILFTGGQDHTLFAVSPKTGNILDQIALNQEMVTAPLATQNAVIISTFNGQLQAFTPHKSSPSWQIQLSAPAFKLEQHQYNIILSKMDGGIQSISLNQGKTKWKHLLNRNAQFWTLMHQEQLYSLNHQGKLNIISLANGQLLNQTTLLQLYAQAPIIHGDNVTLIDSLGNLKTIGFDT